MWGTKVPAVGQKDSRFSVIIQPTYYPFTLYSPALGALWLAECPDLVTGSYPARSGHLVSPESGMPCTLSALGA